MEDILRRQIEQILDRAEVSAQERALEFFQRTADIELPEEVDRYWVLEQFNTLVDAFGESEEDKKTRNVLIMATLFTMGRVWERFYT